MSPRLWVVLFSTPDSSPLRTNLSGSPGESKLVVRSQFLEAKESNFSLKINRENSRNGKIISFALNKTSSKVISKFHAYFQSNVGTGLK